MLTPIVRFPKDFLGRFTFGLLLSYIVGKGGSVVHALIPLLFLLSFLLVFVGGTTRIPPIHPVQDH